MYIYDETNPLYLETYASGVGWELAYYKPGMVQAAQEILHHIAAYSGHHIYKQEPTKHRKIQQHRKRGTRYIIWTQNIPSLLLFK